MGRPIKKKFFGSLNTPYRNFATGGRTGVGAESVAPIAISNSGTVAYSQGVTVTFSAPNIAGGIRATGTASVGATGVAYGGVGQPVNAQGKITAINITNSGTGYTSAPTLTLTTATARSYTSTGTTGAYAIYPSSTTGIYTGMKVIGANIASSATYVTGVSGNAVNLSWPNAGTVNASISFVDLGAGFAKTVSVTSNTQNAINFNSYLTTGTGIVNAGDIMKQESSKRYLVQNAQGQGQCILTATSTLVPGSMNIVASDFNGSTYFVKKLTARRAVVIRSTSSGAGYLVTNGASTGWTLAAATGTIVSIAHTI